MISSEALPETPRLLIHLLAPGSALYPHFTTTGKLFWVLSGFLHLTMKAESTLRIGSSDLIFAELTLLSGAKNNNSW